MELIFSLADDDSVIIGAWFEEPSTPGEGGDDPASGGAQGDSDSSSSPGDSQAKTPHRHNSELTTIVPEKGEPHGVRCFIIYLFDYLCFSYKIRD